MTGSKSRQLIKRSWGLTIVGLGLLGCSYLGQSDSQPGITLIQEIQFNGQSELSVHLQGTVGDRVPLLNSEVYELQDETGVIWVLTPGTAPDPGERVRIQGFVRQQQISVAVDESSAAQEFYGSDDGEIYIEEQVQLDWPRSGTLPKNVGASPVP